MSRPTRDLYFNFPVREGKIVKRGASFFKGLENFFFSSRKKQD